MPTHVVGDADQNTRFEVGGLPSSQVRNAEGLYRRAGKQRRAVDHVRPLLEAAKAEVRRRHNQCSDSLVLNR